MSEYFAAIIYSSGFQDTESILINKTNFIKRSNKYLKDNGAKL